MQNAFIDIPVVFDSVAVLRGDINVRETVGVALAQNNGIVDDLAEIIANQIAHDGFGAEVRKAVLRARPDAILSWAVIITSKVRFDYGGSENLGDRALSSFLVPCQINTDGLVKQLIGHAKFMEIQKHLW